MVSDSALWSAIGFLLIGFCIGMIVGTILEHWQASKPGHYGR